MSWSAINNLTHDIYIRFYRQEKYLENFIKMKKKKTIY